MADCKEYTTLPAVRSLDDLVQELHRVFESDCVNIDYVSALLESYKSNPRDWKKYSKFDIHRYTRNLVDRGNDKFNLMILCWGEGHGSSIHDHSNSHCFVKVLDGHLKETRYDWPKGVSDGGDDQSEDRTEQEAPMVQTDCSVYGKNGVTYINDSLGLHRMENPSHTDTCVTMHLYSPPFNQCQLFDERTGHRNKTTVTFWSQFGKRTPYTATNGCAAPVKTSCSDDCLPMTVSPTNSGDVKCT